MRTCIPLVPTLAILGTTVLLSGAVACGGASSTPANGASSSPTSGAAEAAPSDWPTGKLKFEMSKTQDDGGLFEI